MADRYNPGTVDVERAAEGILDNGGGVNSYWDGDHIHTSVYSKDGGSDHHHLSWDSYSDGSVDGVHTTSSDGHTTYGNER